MQQFKVGDWVREDFGDMNITKIKDTLFGLCRGGKAGGLLCIT